MKEIFIGREEELKKFTENFEKQFVPKKEFWDFKNKIKVRNEDFYKLFLIYGDGGFGKSALARVFSEQAISIFKERQEELKVITIDWDNAGRIDSFRQVLEHICSKLLEPQYGIGKFFKGYGRAVETLKGIQNKIEKRQRESAGLDIGDSTARGLQTVVGYIPTFGDTAKKLMETEIVEKVIAKGVNYTVQAGEKQIDDWVKSRNILNEEDLRLWLNWKDSLIQELVNGFKEASKETAILLVIDTYERIDQFDEDMYLFFLKVLEDVTNRMTIIVSGRRDLSSKYKEKFSDKIAIFINLEKLLFKEADIQEFAKSENLTFSDEELKEIGIHTRGIPFAVKEVISNIKNSIIPKEKLLVALRSSGAGDSDILISTVNRFIKYCNPEDRKKVFSLAILKEYDKELLRKLWGDDLNVETELESLSERHSFISQSKESKNKTFNEYLRKYLILELDESKSSIIRSYLKNYGEIIAEYWFGKLKDYETKEPDIGDRYSDKNYISFLKNYINAVAFADIHKLFSILPGLVLESMQFNLDLCKDIVNAFEEFTPIMTTKQMQTFKTIKEGFDNFTFIDSENGEEKNTEEIVQLIEYFEKNRNGLNDLQKTILECRHAEIIFRRSEFEKVFEHIEKHKHKYLHITKIKNYLADLFFFIGHFSKNVDEKIKSYTHCIELNPNSSDYYSNRGDAHRKLKDYVKAIEDYTKAIEINPQNKFAYHSRGAVYSNLEKNENAMADYNKGIEIDPKYIWAYIDRGSLYIELKDYEKALDDFSKSIEIDPNNISAYNARAFLYESLKEYSKAIADYDRAIEIDPDNCVSYYNCGITFFKMGDYIKAVDSYYKGIEIESDSSIYSDLSQLLFILNRDKEAIESLDKAFSLNPKNRLFVFAELWFYTFAHIPEKREEAKGKLQELITKNILKKGKNSLLVAFRDFSKNIERAIRENHPEPELLKNFAKIITGKDY